MLNSLGFAGLAIFSKNIYFYICVGIIVIFIAVCIYSNIVYFKCRVRQYVTREEAQGQSHAESVHVTVL